METTLREKFARTVQKLTWEQCEAVLTDLLVALTGTDEERKDPSPEAAKSGYIMLAAAHPQYFTHVVEEGS